MYYESCDYLNVGQTKLHYFFLAADAFILPLSLFVRRFIYVQGSQENAKHIFRPFFMPSPALLAVVSN